MDSMQVPGQPQQGLQASCVCHHLPPSMLHAKTQAAHLRLIGMQAAQHPTFADFGTGNHGHEYSLSNELAELHHAGSLQGEDPNSADKMGASRQSIIAEVENSLAAQYAAMPQEELHQWHATLQQGLSESSDAHHKAKDYLKQVDAARALARDAYRADQASIEKQKTWKSRVGELKEAQDNLRTTKESFYRSAAAVEVVTRELKMRTTNVNMPRPPEAVGGPRGGKRKRTAAPEETCPYCNHIYTVRDGLSTKTDLEGNRLHLRKCQCREKTPPCRNCPMCKENSDIMALNDPNLQFQLCQVRFKCDICACREEKAARKAHKVCIWCATAGHIGKDCPNEKIAEMALPCPGAGKWVEGDGESRASYAQRTQARHGQLNAMGWFGNIGIASPAGPSDLHSNPDAMLNNDSGAKRKYRELKRLPADIRAQVALLKGHPATQSPVEGVNQGPGRNSPMPDLLAAGGMPLGLGVQPGGPLGPMSPSMAARALDKPAPALPPEVARLVKDVFESAAGIDAVGAVSDYLRSQRVTSLPDLQVIVIIAIGVKL
ncbi:TPA: hypothetical protein ACH3X3_012574 [Trebouxia sp. C0006]